MVVSYAMDVAVSSLTSSSENAEEMRQLNKYYLGAVRKMTVTNGCCLYCAESETSSEDESDNDVESEVLAMVFWNANLMEQIISYIPLVKDRIKIETCCRRMRDFSRRAPYLKVDTDCSLLDLHFQKTKPEITVSCCGNDIYLPVIVSPNRLPSPDGLISQPASSMYKLRSYLRRFEKQITSLRIGSIHDIQKRMGYINDHELVLTPDLCEILSMLKKLRALCIRNCQMSSQVLDTWTLDECQLMQQIQSFCFHGIWFDKTSDCDRLAQIIKFNVRRLHLSKCGTEVMCQLANRIRHLGIQLEYIYVLLNVHSVNKDYLTKKALEHLSLVCSELRICLCLTTLDSYQERYVLIKTLRLMAEFPKITVLELDLGFPNANEYTYYERFFRGLRDLQNLRTLRISSGLRQNYPLSLWKLMIYGIMHLKTLSELSIRSIGEKLSVFELQNLCEVLPKSLKTLNLHLPRNFRSQHLSIIVDRCEKLESLLILGCSELDGDAIFYALQNLHYLQSLALYLVKPVSESIVNLLCDKVATNTLDDISLGSYEKPPFSSGMLSLLNNRFQYSKQAPNFLCCEEKCDGIETIHLYRTQRGFQRILEGNSFGECPGCEKDLTLFDEEN